MTEFDSSLTGYRLTSTMYNDTLQRVAARELGDANRWVDLANINNLLPPYLTDDPALASDRVLLTGGLLLVPSQSTPIHTAATGIDEDGLYLIDLATKDGALQADDNGDIALCAGRDNLKASLIRRIEVEQGELLFHPRYGCLVRTIVGAVNGPTAALLAAQYVQASLKADPRVSAVLDCRAEVIGDQLPVTANIQPIAGQSTKIQVTL